MSKALCGVAVPTAPLVHEQKPPVVLAEPEAMEAEEALLNGFDDILVDSTTLSDLAWQEFLNQMNVNYGWS
eukprot:symbB.v1.2.029391.t1/scaffold3209.1/size61150/2